LFLRPLNRSRIKLPANRRVSLHRENVRIWTNLSLKTMKQQSNSFWFFF
jgi:hypothetical protein